MTSALGDVTVVELTTELWSSLGSALLGDFGARVIRVEDLSRQPHDPDRDGMHPRESFDADAELVQRNKQSIGIDLGRPEGHEVLDRLLRAADVFFTDLPFAELDARGLGTEVLTGANPGLVYVRGSGFGPSGVDRDLPALDELAAARTGVMPTLPQPGEPPVYAGAGQMYTSVMLALGTMIALHHRGETGEGQVVDASLFAGNMYGAALQLDAYLAIRDDRLSVPVARLDAGNPMSGAGLAYPTSDGRWITLTMPDSDRWWPGFSKLMGFDEDDPRFNTHDKRCGEGREEMMAILDERFAQHTGAHWRQRFDEERLSADVMERYEYVAELAQASMNRYILDLEHTSYGAYQSLGFPIHMGDTPARLRRMAPGVGQHSAEILDEVLDMSDSAIAELELAGVVGTTRNRSSESDRASDSARQSARVAPATGDASPGDVASARGALEGVRVLDLTVWFQGPVCSQHLADFGAEVIHIERPEFGDPARGVRSINAVPVADWNQYFLVVNRNKKSMAIDLKSDEGRALMHKMVAESDVFLWNQSMANLEPLGLDHATLSAINPRLVFATNSGYGHRGINKPAFDMTVQALTGIMTRLGEPGEPPIYLGLGGGDAFGGLMSALGIMVALHRRRVTGEGQYVDASLLGSQLFLAAPTLQRFLATHDTFYSEQHSRTDTVNALWNRYRAQDRWIFLCMENTDVDFALVCAAIAREDLAAVGRFSDPGGRVANRVELIEILDAVLAERPAQEWLDSFRSNGVVAAPINAFCDVAEDEQAWANDYFVRMFCDEAGSEVEFRGLPITLSRTPGRVERLGPELGQDTELALVDSFGCSWEEIGELKAKGAIPVTMAAGPLGGLRVIEISTMMAGPYGATLLGDLGADVIKVESRRGDDSRHLGPQRGGERSAFLSLNRSKRGIVLDLHRADAQEVFGRLVAGADIVVTNVREPALSKLGLDYDRVRSHRSDIIWVGVTAFGADGPYAGRPGIDFLIQGYGGLMALTGEPGGAPVRVTVPLIDTLTSVLVVTGALAAVHSPAATGEGQRIDISLLDALIHAQASGLGSYLITGRETPRTGNRSLYFAPSGVYTTSDDKQVVITCPSQRFFEKLCDALDVTWVSDPLFATIDARMANQDELDATIDEQCRRMTAEELIERLVAADVLTAPVLGVRDVVEDPQVRHNDMIVTTDHSTLGAVDVTGVPIHFGGTPAAVASTPPRLGEHTEAVLGELGYDAGEIAELLAAGAAAVPAE